MITGSVAGLFYGLNRYTEDTDIVVDLDARETIPIPDVPGRT